VVDQEEDQEMPTKKEVLSVKPLAQLSPLKEVRQSLILKKKAKFIIARDLKTPNHLISSKMLVVIELSIGGRESFQSFCFIVYRVKASVPAISAKAFANGLSEFARSIGLNCVGESGRNNSS
jgi:hypothetical protein